MTEHTAPASAPLGAQLHYFTFGLDSPLFNRVIVLWGTADETRETVYAAFGRQQVSSHYTATRWEEIQAKAISRGRPYIQLVLGIPGERAIDPQPGIPAHLIDEHGIDRGEIVEVSGKYTIDPDVRAWNVYTKAP